MPHNPTVLFVCTGNTCRSPMAEALTKSILDSQKVTALIHSAGINARNGCFASDNAIKAMAEKDIELKNHSSRQVSWEMLTDAGLVLTMTQRHLLIIKDICPEVNAFTLSHYASSSGDIMDPFGGALETYQDCARQLHQLILNSIEKMKEDLCLA